MMLVDIVGLYKHVHSERRSHLTYTIALIVCENTRVSQWVFLRIYPETNIRVILLYA